MEGASARWLGRNQMVGLHKPLSACGQSAPGHAISRGKCGPSESYTYRGESRQPRNRLKMRAADHPEVSHDPSGMPQPLPSTEFRKFIETGSTLSDVN